MRLLSASRYGGTSASLLFAAEIQLFENFDHILLTNRSILHYIRPAPLAYGKPFLPPMLPPSKVAPLTVQHEPSLPTLPPAGSLPPRWRNRGSAAA